MPSCSPSWRGCRTRWRQIEARAGAATPPARVHAVDPLQRLLLDQLSPELERIVVGDQATLVRVRTWLAEWQPALADRLVSLPDPLEADRRGRAAGGSAAAERAACAAAAR